MIFNFNTTIKSFHLSLSLTSVLMCSLFIQNLNAKVANAGGDEGQSVQRMFFGDDKSQADQKNCQAADADDYNKKGILGYVNNVLCHLEKDMGLTGVGNSTKTFGSIVVHAEIASATTSLCSGYLNSAQTWICRKTSSETCANPSSFKRMMSLCFSYSSDKSINKGNILIDHLAFGLGAGVSGLNMVYDVGIATSTKTISAKLIHPGFKMRVDSQKSGEIGQGILKYTGVASIGGSSYRTSNAIDKTNNAALLAFETNGGPSSCTQGKLAINLSASGDTPSCTKCFSRKSDGDRDFSFSVTNSETACSSLSLLAYPTDSAAAVNSYTLDTSSTSIMGTNGDWNGMAATPSQI